MNIEPLRFTRGDSISWQRIFAQYSAAEWDLTYYIRGATSLDIVAVANGNIFDVSITSVQTNALTAGYYWWQAVLTKGQERIAIVNGQFIVGENLQSVNTVDVRSHVKKTLDALEAMIEKRASLDQQSYSIQGRSLSRMDIDQLITWREKYRQLWLQEQRNAEAAAGFGRRTKVQVRFPN